MSLPWILADTVLESSNGDLIEFDFVSNGALIATRFVLYPLGIYNDAAHRALHTLRCGFLFDEIEAEVNLCFDQLAWKLSQQIFTEAKTKASRCDKCARI